MLLVVKDLSVNYGQVQALRGVALDVSKGEIVSLIGPNGAGKSTALKSISGTLASDDGIIVSGEILYNGKSILNIPTHRLVYQGISLVPEGRRLFPTMTVQENLEMGGFILGRQRDLRNERLKAVLTLLPFFKKRISQKAGTLSTGEQQLLAIGRALMLNPSLLLLDEPSLGLSPNYITQVVQILDSITQNGTSILLVEQNARLALEVSNRAYVFDIGKIAMSGTAEDLSKNPQIQDIYLGGHAGQ